MMEQTSSAEREPGRAAADAGSPSDRDDAEHFRQIADSSNFVFWILEITPIQRVSYVNPAFERVWGVSAQALYDDPERWMASIHPEDRPAVAQAFRHWLADTVGSEFRVEYRVQRPDGSLRWIADRGRPWRDAAGMPYRVTGIAEDITARKQAEQRAQDSEQQFKALIEGLPQLVWTCRPDGSCDYLSPQWFAFAALPDTAADRADWMALIHPDDSAGALEAWHRSLADQSPFVRQFRLRARDGGYRWFKARALPMRNEAGTVQRWLGSCTDVNNLKQAEAALRDERQRMGLIMRSAPSILHSFTRSPDGSVRITHGSERVAALFELPEVVIRRDASVINGRIDDATRARIHASMAEAARTMTPWLDQFRIVTPSRGPVWVECHFAPVRDESGAISWHGSLTDISQRRAAEQALADSRVQLQALFDHLQDGLITLAPDGSLLQWNPTAMRLHGFNGGEDVHSVGDRLLDSFELSTLEGEPVARADWPVLRILRGETLHEVEMRVHHREQGWTRVLSYSGALLTGADGQTILSMMHMRDVTDRRRQDDELRRLTHTLEDRVRERTAELEAAIAELEAFSYSVSHDLRAPLRAMDGFAALLLRDHEDRLEPSGQRYLRAIHESSRKMGQLIDDLLAFARLSRQPLSKRRIDTTMVVRDVIRQLQPLQQGREVDWIVADLPPCEGDLAMLRQAWINLLSNALKYSRRRAHAVIEIGARDGSAGREYYVRDNGTGFDMAHAHKLFGVFERLHRDDEFEGTGVGLALVQRIVQRHGGEIHAIGQPGQGATFSFSLGTTH